MEFHVYLYAGRVYCVFTVKQIVRLVPGASVSSRYHLVHCSNACH